LGIAAAFPILGGRLLKRLLLTTTRKEDLFPILGGRLLKALAYYATAGNGMSFPILGGRLLK